MQEEEGLGAERASGRAPDDPLAEEDSDPLAEEDSDSDEIKEEEDEDWDPDSLVGQIEAEQKREEEAAKIRLMHMQIESHNRVKQRLLKRKLSPKKKTAVTPVQAPSEVGVTKEPEEEEDGMSI